MLSPSTPRKAEVQVVGQPPVGVARPVELERVDALLQFAAQLVAQAPGVSGALRALLLGELQGGGEARGGGDAFRAGAALLFLPAAEQLRLERRAAALVEQPRALGAVDFVRGEREQVDAKDVGPNVDRAGGLHGVGVDDGLWIALFDRAGDLGDGLDRADFVVGGHHRDEDGVVAHRLGGLVGIDEALGVDGQDGELEAFGSERPPSGGARRGARRRR